MWSGLLNLQIMNNVAVLSPLCAVCDVRVGVEWWEDMTEMGLVIGNIHTRRDPLSWVTFLLCCVVPGSGSGFLCGRWVGSQGR